MIKTKILTQWLICLSVFLLPFYSFKVSVLGFPTNILEITVLLAFLSSVYCLLSTSRRWNFGPIWPYLFLAAACLAVYFADDKTKALGILKGWFFVPAALYFSVINIFDSIDFKKISLVLIPSIFVVSLWAIAQRLGFVGTVLYQNGNLDLSQYLTAPIRAFGPFDSPNFLAMFLVPAIFLSLPAFGTVKKKLYIAILVIIEFAALIAVYLSGSRAGLVALAAGAFGFLLVYAVSRKKIILTVSAIIFSLVAIFATYIFINTTDKTRAESNNARLQIYHYSIQILKENPIRGVGLGDFENKIDQISADDDAFRKTTLSYAIHPHNIFLAMWLNLGVAGFTAFLALIILFMIYIWRGRRSSLLAGVAFASMIAILAHGIFDTTYFKNDLSALFWLAFALALIASNDDKNSLKN